MAQSRSLAEKSYVVLIVDDDDDVRELLRVELELEGYTTVTASNGAEAISTIHRISPDVILMDVLMPKMNGIEATEIIKQDEVTKHIPILMITVVDNQEDIIKGLEAGATDYITKPFFLPELKARLNAIIRYKRLYDEIKSMQKQLLKNERINTIKELTSIIQESNDNRLTVILSKVDLIRRKKGKATEEDLYSIERAANKVKNTINKLKVLDLFSPVASNVDHILNLDILKAENEPR
jgi:DNA-binding response OmpR family regulator